MSQALCSQAHQGDQIVQFFTNLDTFESSMLFFRVGASILPRDGVAPMLQILLQPGNFTKQPAGNSNWRERLSTVDLLIKVSGFVINVNNIPNLKQRLS